MSALSEAERIDRERKELRKRQIIAGMIEDSVMQRELKKERQKSRDFAQQTKSQARVVEYTADNRVVGGLSLGGKRSGAGAGWRGDKGEGLFAEKPGQGLFADNQRSALEYGKGTTRTKHGLFTAAKSIVSTNIAVDRLKERQRWTTGGYKDEYSGEIFAGYGPEKLEMITTGTGPEATSELRRRARARNRIRETVQTKPGTTPDIAIRQSTGQSPETRSSTDRTGGYRAGCGLGI
jgi:hypothetical protein